MIFFKKKIQTSYFFLSCIFIFVFLITITGFSETKKKLPWEGYTQHLNTHASDTPEFQSVIEKVQKAPVQEHSFQKEGLHYTEKLKRKLLEKTEEKKSSKNYTQKLKASASKTQEPFKSPIRAVEQGTSALKLKRPGTISGALSFQMSPWLDQTWTPKKGSIRFEDIYSNQYFPYINIQYEWMLFRRERAFQISVGISGGIWNQKGQGSFEFVLQNPVTSASFGSQSQIEFSFMAFPASVYGKFQLNFLHYLRPYAFGGVGSVFLLELRSDGGDDLVSHAEAYYMGAGVLFLMDWINQKFSWNLYETAHIKHVYLKAEAWTTQSFSGLVSWDLKAFFAGFLFEM